VIAAVLLLGLVLTWVRRHQLARIGLVAQGLALLGTVIGILTVIGGISPRTVPDIVYHVAILLVLGWGLAIARQQAVGGGR
jgi:hypothetical protein